MSKLERKTDLSCTENHISAVKSSTNIKETFVETNNFFTSKYTVTNINVSIIGQTLTNNK